MRDAAVAMAAWVVAAYLILPALWEHYEHNPALADAPKTTVTAQGIPGDPLNLGLIGPEPDLIRALTDAGWVPADPITLRTSMAIARSVLTGKPDPDAPVSNLYVFGRRQDLAFEKAAGNERPPAASRPILEVERDAPEGGPIWIGAATFDRSVGLSHLTGQVTHHIAPAVDAERDGLIGDLSRAGRLSRIYQVTGVGATLDGRNGGGDRFFTDGEMTLGVLSREGQSSEPPDLLTNPVAVRIKDQFWSAVRPVLEATAGSE